MNWDASLTSILTALCIGLLIGTTRQRLHQPDVMKAGIRTHAIVALLGAISYLIGFEVFIVALLVAGFLIGISYRQSVLTDPGMTGEFVLFLTLLLSGLAMKNAPLAAALGVVTACLVFIKKLLRKFSQEKLTEKELEDALMLCASALVVLPLLPIEPIDRWNALQPYAIWKIVVLIMGVGMLSHVLMRMVGMKGGLVLAGFLTGFISSTGAVSEFGRNTREKPEHASLASAAAMFSVLSSLLLFALILGASSEKLLRAMAWPLSATALALASTGFYFLHHAHAAIDFEPLTSRHAFKISHAVVIAAMISMVTLCSAWLKELFGDSGIWVTTVLVGFAEIHAAAVGIAKITQEEQSQIYFASWGIVAILGASMASKIFLAYFSGGKIYGQKITCGLLLAIAATAGILLIKQGL